jgi:GNAT superfamily N-acetyltransferase
MKSKVEISYRIVANVKAGDVASVFKKSGIKRPIDDLDRIQKMIDNADITITAWDCDKLIGIARAITDYSYCCYLSDLAVDKEYQLQGIGKQLINVLQEQIGEEVSLLLLASPTAMEYYPHIGFNKIDNGFIIPRKK